MQQRQEIKQYLAENFLFSSDASAIGDSDSLINTGIIDSTGIHELILFLEEAFQLVVEPAEMVPANFDTVDAIDGFVKRKRALAAVG